MKLIATLVLLSLVVAVVRGEHDHHEGHEGHDHSHAHQHHHEKRPTPVQHKGHDEHHHHEHAERHHHHDEEEDDAPRSTQEIYTWAIGSTAAIGVAPVIFLYFVPISANNEGALKIWLAFAAGGLLGDVFLHLIPHAISPHGHDDHSAHDHSAHAHSEGAHDHSAEMTLGLWVLAGILVFFIVEKWVSSLHGADGHSHSHSHSDNANGKGKQKKQRGVAVAGWLNLVADFSHNFTDGLAIGASFLSSHRLGLITTAAVFLHEIPHEIGDVAILLKSGMTRKGAFLAQIVTAVGCVLGTCMSLWIDNIAESSLWVLPFTAGGFIYIATVSVLPELLKDHKLGQSIKEIFAMVFGIALMYGIGLFE